MTADFGFEDIVWLFTNNTSNRGLIRQNLNEAALLWKAVKATEGPIMEIGRCFGGSTVLLAAAAGDRPILSLDIQEGIKPAAEGFLQGRDNVFCVVGDSRQPYQGSLAPFGLIFVDGDHTYEGVSADIRAHWPELFKGGSMVFHDAEPNSDNAGTGASTHCEGVNRAVSELLDGGDAELVTVAGSSVWVRKVR